jgi:hypothetical protein
MRQFFFEKFPRPGSIEQTVEALDLHVLGTPPAFILSQDQTLHKSEIALTYILSLKTQIRTDVDLHYSVFNERLKG